MHKKAEYEFTLSRVSHVLLISLRYCKITGNVGFKFFWSGKSYHSFYKVKKKGDTTILWKNVGDLMSYLRNLHSNVIAQPPMQINCSFSFILQHSAGIQCIPGAVSYIYFFTSLRYFILQPRFVQELAVVVGRSVPKYRHPEFHSWLQLRNHLPRWWD